MLLLLRNLARVPFSNPNKLTQHELACNLSQSTAGLILVVVVVVSPSGAISSAFVVYVFGSQCNAMSSVGPESNSNVASHHCVQPVNDERSKLSIV